MTFTTTWCDNHIFIDVGQEASGSDIFKTLEVISSDDRFDASLNQLWDFSKTVKFNLGSVDLKSIYNLSLRKLILRSTSYLALVAPDPNVYYLLQALLTFTTAGRCNSKIFNKEEEALAWIQRNYV